MCLITDKQYPYVAERDIICYKFIIARSETDFITPYQGSVYKYNKLIKALGNPNPSYAGNSSWTGKKIFEIGSGYIHAYTNPQIIKELKGIYFFNSYKIIKGIIKKGTYYYENKDTGEICAREMYLTNKFVD